MRSIRPLVEPRSIAVIGASTNARKSGGILFANLSGGTFQGQLYPVNPRAPEVQGHTAFATVGDLPEVVDLAYVVLPRDHVKGAIEECARKGVRAACIITSGFAEVSDAGLALEREIAAIARDGGVLLAGPNTIGMVNARIGMMGSFVSFPRWETGSVSIFAQTGIFTGAAMLQVMSAETQRLPVGMSIDVGNKPDVDESDFLAFAADDAGTSVIGLYLESIVDRERFLDLATAVTRRKPVVLLMPGHTQAARAASRLHTGSRMEAMPGLDADLAQAGVIRVEDECSLIEVLRAHACLPCPKGKRVGVVTTSGALGVMAMDQLILAGLEPAPFARETVQALQVGLPDWQPAANPYDFWIAVDTIGSGRGHQIALAAALGDPNTDMVLATLLSPPNADFEGFGALLAEARARYPEKPLALVICGGPVRERWIRELEGANVPVFPSTRAAVEAIAALAGARRLRSTVEWEEAPRRRRE